MNKWKQLKLTVKHHIQERLGIAALQRENDRIIRYTSDTRGEIERRIDELDKLTKIDADVGFRGDCSIILTGVYRGKAYVKMYDMPPDHFREYVERLRWERKEHLIRNVDQPPQFMGSFDL